MRILLDTHVLLWSQAEPGRLGPAATESLLDEAYSLYVSPISTLEVARLVALGQVRIKGTLQEWLSASMDLLGCLTAELTHRVSIEAYSLPGKFHRDPADRILVATARVNDMALMTADERIVGYTHVRTVDACK